MSGAATRAVARVAVWMLRRFEDAGGYLDHEDAACNVSAIFGEPYAITGDNGNVRIAREVLAAFRSRSRDVVWDRSERAWRRRHGGDEPGTRQG